MSPFIEEFLNPHRKLFCPLCGQRWEEGGEKKLRQRGSCPGCGAGDDEMFRALLVEYARVRRET